MRHFAMAVLAAAQIGCAAGPDYSAPALPEVQFRHAAAANVEPAAPDAAWWRTFDDPVLTGLFERAFTRDFDLRVAEARWRASRALFREQSQDRFPAVTAAAAYDQRDAQQPGFTRTRIDYETYELGFDAAWEIDLFGRVRRGVQAARAEADVAEANLRAAQVSVAAEVARTDLELRGAARRHAVAIANRDNQAETVRITQLRYELGRGTELEVESAKARLAQTQASIPPRAALRVRRLERSVFFYKNVFGFRVIADARRDREASVIMAAPGQVCLTLREEKRLQDVSSIDAVKRGASRLTLVVDDLDEARASLWDLGVPLAHGAREPGEDPRAIRTRIVNDPDGHRIEFAERTRLAGTGSL